MAEGVKTDSENVVFSFSSSTSMPQGVKTAYYNVVFSVGRTQSPLSNAVFVEVCRHRDKVVVVLWLAYMVAWLASFVWLASFA